jgi:hypothetical protein
MVKRYPSPPVPDLLRGKAVETHLPVGVFHDNALVTPHDTKRHIIAVGDRIGRKMGNIAIGTRPLGIGSAFFEKIFSGMPAMTVKKVAGILFPESYIGRDAAVKKIVREIAEKGGKRSRKQLEIAQNSRSQLQVETGTPGIYAVRDQNKCNSYGNSGQKHSHILGKQPVNVKGIGTCPPLMKKPCSQEH